MELKEGLKDMVWVKDSNQKLTLDPFSPEIHPQLSQFILEPKSVNIKLEMDKTLNPVGYRHYESEKFDVVRVNHVPVDDKQ